VETVVSIIGEGSDFGVSRASVLSDLGDVALEVIEVRHFFAILEGHFCDAIERVVIVGSLIPTIAALAKASSAVPRALDSLGQTSQIVVLKIANLSGTGNLQGIWVNCPHFNLSQTVSWIGLIDPPIFAAQGWDRGAG
jgi:hypothetical protein